MMTMPEEIKTPNVQDQIRKVRKIIDRGLFLMFFAGIIGTTCSGIFFILANALFTSPIGLIIGVLISGFFVTFCAIYVQNARAEYEKLLEQLQQTPNVSA